MVNTADEDAFMSELLNDLGTQLSAGLSSPSPTPAPAPTRHSVPSTRAFQRQDVAFEDEAASLVLEADPKDHSPRTARVFAPSSSFPSCGGSDVDWEEMADCWDAMQQAAEAAKPRPTPALQKEELTRCVVDSVVERQCNGRHEKMLRATRASSDGELEIILRDDWVLTRAHKGDILHIIGPFATDTTPPSIVLSAAANSLILHPDVLLTATHVSTSHRCARKPVLAQLLPGAGPDSAPAVAWGNMLHEVVQTCFTERDFSPAFVDSRIDAVVDASLSDLARIGVAADPARDELHRRSAGLQGFSQRFVADTPREDAVVTDLGATSAERTLVALTDVNAIEEDVWSPRYGLKGKVDASVQTSVKEGAEGVVTEWTQPFEIKTGRSIAGLEHRAQTMLYALLMAERYGVEVPSGLLYYTQNSELIRVPVRRHDLRALMISRNEMAAFIAGRWRDGYKVSEANDFLPPPIDDEYVCGKCFNLDACMLYRKAVEGNPVAPNDEVFKIWLDRTDHLTDAHCEFFTHWERLIALEEADMTRFRRELWTMTAREREVRGRAFSDLVLAPGAAMTEDKRHVYTFKRRAGLGVLTDSLLTGHISRGDAVTVTVEPDLIAFARGFVVELHPDSVSIGVDQPMQLGGRILSGRGTKDALVFRIDKDELAGGIARIRDNLARLFIKGGDERRRKLIVDLEAPRFFESDKSGRPNPKLNPHQQAAVRKVMSAEDYALVLGLPGTGKTTTTAEIIRQFVKQGKSVLLTSYTHSAVDTILRTLGRVDFDILRLGKVDKVHPDVRKYTLDARGPAKTLEQYEGRIMVPPVVATTCLSIDHPVFSRRRFDVCIVDEASQITLPTCIGPLRNADVFVLVGDHYQLAPLVRSTRARKDGLDVSLFRRLCEAHPEAVADLALQYRMNEDIMTLSNDLVYNGRLMCGSEQIARQTLRINSQVKCKQGCWVERVVSESTKVLFVDTDAVPAAETKAADLVHNDVEVQLIQQICDALIARGVNETDIGVISLYRQQLKALQHALQARSKLEILTVDRSQGRDKECVLVSMVRSNAEGDTGELLKDWRRINVALTRARRKLVIMGSRKTLNKIEVLHKFFDLCDRRGWILALPKDAHTEHELHAHGCQGVKRPLAADVPAGKENEASVVRKKAKVVTASGEAILRTRPLLRDVVNNDA